MITMQLAEEEVLRERERCAKIAKGAVNNVLPAPLDPYYRGYADACREITEAIQKGENHQCTTK